VARLRRNGPLLRAQQRPMPVIGCLGTASL
jgi:hypothetical protein